MSSYADGKYDNLHSRADTGAGNLESYFTRSDKGYVVRAHIREMVCFSSLDLTSTIKPPFMELDCVFCCNVLIYLQKQLLEKVWGWEYTDDVDYVRIYISHLRQKIEPDPASPRYIVTEPGVGYYFQKQS